jgi:cytochrome c oxidase subunit 1
VLYFVVILATVSFGERGVDTPMPIAEATEGATTEWPVLERWGLWIGATVALILIAYLPFFLTYLPAHPISEGMRVW